MITDRQKRKDVGDRATALIRDIAKELPDIIAVASIDAIDAWAAVEGLTDGNKELVGDIVSVVKKCATHSLDIKLVMEEIQRRAKLMNQHRAVRSVYDDLNAYPTRWPGL